MAQAVEGESGKGQTRPLWKDHNLHVIWCVTLMAILDSSSIAPALPKVVQELGVSPGQVGLLITVFALPGVFLTSAAGALSERFGRRKILVLSLMLFGISVCMPRPAIANFQAFLGQLRHMRDAHRVIHNMLWKILCVWWISGIGVTNFKLFLIASSHTGSEGSRGGKVGRCLYN